MTKPKEPTLTCSEVVERLTNAVDELFIVSCKCEPDKMCGACKKLELFQYQAEIILHSWRERRVQELEEAHELFLAQLKTALGIADDGRVWFGAGLLARAETLVLRESEWREQIRKGAK